MKKLLVLAVAAVFGVGIWATLAIAGDQDKGMMGQKTVEGTLVDAKCYLMAAGMNKPEMNFGNDHMVKGHDGNMMKMPSCATACANMGIPAAIVEGGKPGGKTYIIIAPASTFAEHMAKNARITGTLTDAGIIAMKAEVNDGGKWKEVAIAGMM